MRSRPLSPGVRFKVFRRVVLKGVEALWGLCRLSKAVLLAMVSIQSTLKRPMLGKPSFEQPRVRFVAALSQTRAWAD